MKTITFESVKKQESAWFDYYCRNNMRGKSMIDFALAGNQWEGGIPERRQLENKESLTLNLCIKHLKRLKAQGREIEFSLDVAPISKEIQEDVERTNAFRLLLHTIMLDDDKLSTFAELFDKSVDYGYAVAEVNFKREDSQSLNLIPCVKNHRDPAIAFWDKNAIHPCKIDGRFCGLKKILSKEEILCKLPKVKSSPFLQEKDNEVRYYWYRDYEPANFILLNNGQYKREDLLTIDDKNNLYTEKDGDQKKLIETADICKIYFVVFLNEQMIGKPVLFPTDDLPLVYHPSFTFWHPEYGDFSVPLITHLKGAQQLHNYINSQIATTAKYCNSDKWLFSEEHVRTEMNKKAAKEINKKDGAFKFSGNIESIRRERAAEIPQTLIEMSGQTKQEIDEISGAMVDTANAQQTVISGQALDKITHNLTLIHADVIAGHILFVSTIGELFRQMIPKIITEERTIVCKNKDGSGQVITINELLPTGDILNNIKDVNNNFKYQIKASPTSAMRKENTVRYLSQIYSINPEEFNNTGDIFYRNLQSEDAGELERRKAATMDTDLIKYSQGEITLEEYQQRMQQKQQSQIEQQAQLANLDPQVQGSRALAQAETEKAKAAQHQAVTKRMDVINKAKEGQEKLKVQLANLLLKSNLESAQHDIDTLRAAIDANQQLIDYNQQQFENSGMGFGEQDNDAAAPDA